MGTFAPRAHRPPHRVQLCCPVAPAFTHLHCLHVKRFAWYTKLKNIPLKAVFIKDLRHGLGGASKRQTLTFRQNMVHIHICNAAPRASFQSCKELLGIVKNPKREVPSQKDKKPDPRLCPLALRKAQGLQETKEFQMSSVPWYQAKAAPAAPFARLSLKPFLLHSFKLRQNNRVSPLSNGPSRSMSKFQQTHGLPMLTKITRYPQGFCYLLSMSHPRRTFVENCGLNRKTGQVVTL